MESAQPVQLSNIFTEDYKHFETNFEKHPEEAKAVFGYVAELRAALQAFREATIGRVGGEEVENKAAEPESADPASLLLGSSEGSVEHHEIVTAPIDVA